MIDPQFLGASEWLFDRSQLPLKDPVTGAAPTGSGSVVKTEAKVGLRKERGS